MIYTNSTYSLLNLDCCEATALLPEQSVDLVLTDPPYNLGLFMKSRHVAIKSIRENHFSHAGWDDLEQSEWEKMMDSLFSELPRVVKAGGAIVMFMSLMKVETIVRLAQRHGFYYKTTGVWHKRNPIPRNMNIQFVNSTEGWIYFTHKKRSGTFNNEGRAIHDFFETCVTPARERRLGKHATQKPIELLQKFVKLLTNEGDTVYDPFCGSGSSGVAAVSLGRYFIGFDVKEEYIELSKKRIEQLETKGDSDVDK